MRRAALLLALALSPGVAAADEAFITNQQADSVSVLDLDTRAVVATIQVAGHPAGIDSIQSNTKR